MARYDAHGHRNQGFDGYDMKELPSYGAAIVGYSTTSESYSASSEEIVKYGRYPPYSNHPQVWPRNSNSTYIQPKKGDEYEHPYSPKFSHISGSPHGSPRNNFHRANSPSHGHHPGSPYDSPRKNSKGHYFDMYGSPHESPRRNFRSDDDSSDDEEIECRDGVCYPKPKHNNEKNKGNGYGYGAGNYPMVHPPEHQTHHKTSDPHKYAEYKKPVTDAYYDRFAYPTNYEHKVSAPIKTKPDHHRDTRNSPVRAGYGGSPRREAMIDSTEAQWRHGTAPSQPEHKYKRTIDSETLAKLYGGVFVK